MKKRIVAALVAMVAVFVLALSLTACSTSFVGTYKFKSMSYTEGGIQMNLEAGQEFMMGITITEDFYVLEIKEDNTCTMSVMAGSETIEGTWTAEGKTLKIELDGEIQEATLSGKTLTMHMDMDGTNATITFKKQ